jgi:hypothetical protein
MWNWKIQDHVGKARFRKNLDLGKQDFVDVWEKQVIIVNPSLRMMYFSMWTWRLMGFENETTVSVDVLKRFYWQYDARINFRKLRKCDTTYNTYNNTLGQNMTNAFCKRPDTKSVSVLCGHVIFVTSTQLYGCRMKQFYSISK